eukprot:scaffold211762_cov19-Tisochrysis_lutea.AAC.1
MNERCPNQLASYGCRLSSQLYVCGEHASSKRPSSHPGMLCQCSCLNQRKALKAKANAQLQDAVQHLMEHASKGAEAWQGCHVFESCGEQGCMCYQQ